MPFEIYLAICLFIGMACGLIISLGLTGQL